MAIKIQLSYQIVDNSTNPPTVIAPSPSTFYTGSFDTGAQVRQFIIDNAQAKVDQTAPAAALAAQVRDQVDN